jgi:hypothetical protein
MAVFNPSDTPTHDASRTKKSCKQKGKTMPMITILAASPREGPSAGSPVSTHCVHNEISTTVTPQWLLDISIKKPPTRGTLEVEASLMVNERVSNINR